MISYPHLAGIVAFSLWGLFPLYWKMFTELSAWDLFGHRLIWSFVTLFGILLFKRNLSSLKKIWDQPKLRYYLILSALCISSNWLLYIYAIQIGKVLEASMGYFLNPIINIFFGWLILKEKIRPTQWPAIILATFSMVLIATQASLASFPWMALTLSITFALYGLIRKVAHVGAIEGLSFETSIVIIPTLIAWGFFPHGPSYIFSVVPTWKIIALSFSGILTCLPLVLFAYSAKNLELRTLGFIQYLSPSLKFMCGLFILGEPLAPERLQAFVVIWIALIWYTLESFYFINKNRKSKKSTPFIE